MQNIKHTTVTAKDSATIPVVLYNTEADNKKGIVLICHGFGEHSGGYIEHAGRLWHGKYASVLFDQRGHGKPPEGVKTWQGIIPNYQCFIDDLTAVTNMIKESYPGVPTALYGHSMGGNIIINTLLRLSPEESKTYFCAMLDSPWLDLNKPLNVPAKTLLHVLSIVLPNVRNYRKLRSKDMTGETEKKPDYVKDPYNHGYISMRMIAGISDGCRFAEKNAEKLPINTYIAYADKEVVVSQKAIIEFAVKAGDKVTLKQYSSHHAIYKDISREQYCRDLIEFLDSNTPCI